jgi:tetratricopeptide (TPR) repeat protein
MLTSHLLSISNNDKALSIDPNNGDALTNKGLAIYNLGNKTDAISYFVKALQIDP